MNATVTVDQTEHTYSSVTIPGSFRDGGTRYMPKCSCSWHGTPVAGAGNDVGQWNQHVGVGES
jgi:hypothetical protein